MFSPLPDCFRSRSILNSARGGLGSSFFERDTIRVGGTRVKPSQRFARHTSARDVRKAQELVRQWGWNATAYQIVNPGIEHWFSRGGDAVIGFVRRHGVRVVAG